jgi:hypothetical protein
MSLPLSRRWPFGHNIEIMIAGSRSGKSDRAGFILSPPRRKDGGIFDWGEKILLRVYCLRKPWYFPREVFPLFTLTGWRGGLIASL